jgi:hypothetical protein
METSNDSDPHQGSTDSPNESISSIELYESVTQHLEPQGSVLDLSLSLKPKRKAPPMGPSSPLPETQVLTGSENHRQVGAKYSRSDGDLKGPSLESCGVLESERTPFKPMVSPLGANNRWPSVWAGVCSAPLKITHDKNRVGPPPPSHFIHELTKQAINQTKPSKIPVTQTVTPLTTKGKGHLARFTQRDNKQTPWDTKLFPSETEATQKRQHIKYARPCQTA